MHRHHHGHYRPNPLDISEMADFDATLTDIDEKEKKRRRVCYLQEAVRETKLGKKMMTGFGCLLIPFLIIPIFWPFVILFFFTARSAKKRLDQQFTAALNYWQIDPIEIQL